MPEKLNQDKLELLFAKLRRSVGDGDNPSVEEVGHRFLSLLITGSKTITPRNANCEIDYVHGTEGFRLKRHRRN